MTWHYSNTSVETSLTVFCSSVATTMTVQSTTGFPVSFPYSLIVDYGQSTREVVSVTSAVGAVLTISRGQDGTSAGDHSVGAVVVHGVVARDLSEPQAHIAASTNVHGVGSSVSVVGTTTTQTLTNKSLDGSTNTITNIAGSEVIGNIDAQQIVGDLQVDSVLVDGDIDADDITATGTVTGADITTAGRATAATLTVNAFDVTGTWSSYSPTWTANVSNPTLGNGTLAGRYRKIGKTYDVFVSLTIGGTTSIGSGTYFITLPSTAAFFHPGALYMSDVSASADKFGICRVWNTTPDRMFFVSASGLVSQAVPHTWATGDMLIAQVTYSE